MQQNASISKTFYIQLLYFFITLHLLSLSQEKEATVIDNLLNGLDF